jgi:zinc protease
LSAALAPSAAAAPAEAPPVVRWSLVNGLEVALVSRPSPAVAVQVWYRAGSADEPADKRGVAHMFEHLMFEGSARVKPKDHRALLARHGGYATAMTTEDATAFSNVIPADHFEVALQLEAERMRSLLFLDPIIAEQRKLVAGEVRGNLRNPLYAAVVRFLPVAFGGHPYSWTSGGVAGELDAIQAADLEAFYNRFYRPNNALLVIVGNIDEKRARAAVDRHFSSLERGPELERIGAPPALSATRVVADPSRVGFTMLGYRIPAATDDDMYPLQLLSLVMSRGESSRLYQRLVGKNLAVEAGGQAIVRRQPGLFMVFGAFNNPAAGDPVEKALIAEIERVRRQGVTAAELDRARNQAAASLGFALQGVDGMARQIGTAWVHTGDPARFRDDLTRLAAVKVADIARVAKKYLADDKRVTLVIPVATGEGKSQ